MTSTTLNAIQLLNSDYKVIIKLNSDYKVIASLIPPNEKSCSSNKLLFSVFVFHLSQTSELPLNCIQLIFKSSLDLQKKNSMIFIKIA